VLITNWHSTTRTFGDFSQLDLARARRLRVLHNGGTKGLHLQPSLQDGDGGAGAKEAEKKERGEEGWRGRASPRRPPRVPGGPPPQPRRCTSAKDEGRTPHGLNVFNESRRSPWSARRPETDSAIQDAVISHCEWNNK